MTPQARVQAAIEILDLVIAAAHKTGRIVTVEEHYQDGGLGTLVSEVCSSECPVPVKRLGKPSEIASIIAWLASEEAGYSTGADFSVNGGLHMG